MVVTDVNDRSGREPRREEVTRVGRKLVYVKEYGREYSYRLEDGTRNDNYGHSHIWTEDEWTERERRVNVTTALREAGLETVGYSWKFDTHTLEEILAVVSK